MMVVKNFPYIFCYIARSSKDLESPFSFVENVSFTIAYLLRSQRGEGEGGRFKV